MGSISAVPKLFPPDLVNHVTGIYQCAYGSAVIVFSPVCTYLMLLYGVQGMFLIASALFLNIIPLAMAFNPRDMKKKVHSIHGSYSGSYEDVPKVFTDPEENNTSIDPSSSIKPNESVMSFTDIVKTFQAEPFKLFDMLRNPFIVATLVMFFLRSLGQDVPSLFLPLKASYLGIPAIYASFFVSVYGLGDIMGRLTVGLVGQRLAILAIGIIIDAAMIVTYTGLAYTTSYDGIMIESLFCGIIVGWNQVVLSTAGLELYPSR